jgi:hypothetical protein
MVSDQERQEAMKRDILMARSGALRYRPRPGRRAASHPPRTVGMHRANVMTKLGLKSRAELICFTIDNELAQFT